MGGRGIEPLREGKRAPAFTLLDHEGEKHQLTAIDCQFKVIYFYPKDSTPGCTIEAKGFSKELNKFEKIGAAVFGISGGDVESKAKFCKRAKLRGTLLSDSDFSISKKYGVYGPKKFMGRTFNGIARTTFVLDQNNTIIKVFDKVKPASHPGEVLAFLRAFISKQAA